MNKRILLWLPAVALFAVFLPFPSCARETDAAAESRAECVVETESRRVLFSKDAETPLPMASTTKILTASMIIEDCDLDEEICVPEEAAGVEGSSVYLKAGEKYTVRELLYGLMLRSGNDCAVALALHHSGSEEKFVRKMNERARALGARDSFFANPHGLPDERHHTTAFDLAMIAADAMEKPEFREIVSCEYYAPRGWKNKNKMLQTYEGATGIKTGFTLDAGRCLVTAAERDGMRPVCVVLNSPQMYERSAELLDGAFSDYEMVALCRENELVGGMLAKYPFSYPLTETERAQIRTETEAAARPPARAGEIAGQMKIYLKKDLLFSQNLYMIEE